MNTARLLATGFALLIVTMVSGCGVPIVGVHEEVVKTPGPEGPWTTAFWITVGLFVVAALAHTVVLARKKGTRVAIITTVVGIVVPALLCYTFLGAWGYLVIDWINSWGLIGAVVLVIGAIAEGFSPGFRGATPVVIYVIYQDPILLTLCAIPSLGADVLEAIYKIAKPDEDDEDDEDDE